MAASSAGGSNGKASGLVLRIQRMSTEDGPGLRTTAFLKGCPLSCAWCHNPESISARPEPLWTASRCMGCGSCLAACDRRALSVKDSGGLLIDRLACGACQAEGHPCPAAEACPTEALELLGRRLSAEALALELLKDAAYFLNSDRGGVTLSGGEASAQPSFVLETLEALRRAGIHTALDTCGYAPWASLASLYPEVDLVLWDLKELDSSFHASFTGQGNELVIDNFRRTAEAMERSGRPGAMWIRTPIIPGATDREENLYGLGRLIGAVAPPRLERWELCAFNNLCADKHSALGRDWAYSGRPLCEPEVMARLAEAARSGLEAGSAERVPGREAVSLDCVSCTGATRLAAERMEQCVRP